MLSVLAVKSLKPDSWFCRNNYAQRSVAVADNNLTERRTESLHKADNKSENTLAEEARCHRWVVWRRYHIPGINPFIARIIFARPTFSMRFIISRICSN